METIEIRPEWRACVHCKREFGTRTAKHSKGNVRVCCSEISLGDGVAVNGECFDCCPLHKHAHARKAG